jgi:hypothetical protein
MSARHKTNRIVTVDNVIAPNKEFALMKVLPFHSKLPGTAKYHNNNACTEGNNIETYNRVSGTGNLLLCHHCANL